MFGYWDNYIIMAVSFVALAIDIYELFFQRPMLEPLWMLMKVSAALSLFMSFAVEFIYLTGLVPPEIIMHGDLFGIAHFMLACTLLMKGFAELKFKARVKNG